MVAEYRGEGSVGVPIYDSIDYYGDTECQGKINNI